MVRVLAAALILMLSTSFAEERLSLNVHDIEVSAALQWLSEFSDDNIIVSENVQGSMTLNVQELTWQQIFDAILKSQYLAAREEDNIIWVAPLEEILAYERDSLQASQDVAELVPLHSEYIQINYAKAAELAALIKAKDNSLLSARGNISLDSRTNTLLLQDTSQKVTEIKALIERLDVPVQQVLIDARIVELRDGFDRDLGVRFGISHDKGVSGSLEGASSLRETGKSDLSDRLNVDFGVSGPSMGFSLAKLPGNILLDLELSALEVEDHAKVIASPRLITANQQEAYIEQGEELPFEEQTASGATNVAFKKAVLRLQVTPQITPEGRIIMDLLVNQDSVSEITVKDVPAISTKELKTQVLVEDGQTIVLGGIYKQNQVSKIQRVPVLWQLPWIGWLFRSESSISSRDQLLIFVRPTILPLEPSK